MRWVILALIAAGCGGDDGTADAAVADSSATNFADAAIDALTDAPVDAMPDAAIDAPVDAMPDAPVDAMPDAPVDAMPDAPVDAMPDAPVDATPDAPTSTYELTVINYLEWCSVSVNGGAPSPDPVQVVNVMPGTIPLEASALEGFILDANMWHHTDGDSGNGEGGTVSGGISSTSVTVGMAPKCVWVCCPFTDGSGCPTADQCP